MVNGVTNTMFKPMLASALPAPFILSPARFPMFASPKLDGIRATVQGGVVYTRTLKPMVNSYIQKHFGVMELEGLDGELIVGSPTAPDCFKKSGAVLSDKGEPKATFWVFDWFNPVLTFGERLQEAETRVAAFKAAYPESPLEVVVVDQSLIKSPSELKDYEDGSVEAGFEGTMIRVVWGPYKQGRSTVNEGYLLKLKRFTDGEGEVLEILEGETNLNPAYVNEVGATKRSTAKAGKAKNGKLGSFVVRNLESGVIHRVSGGGTEAETAEIWANKEAYVGRILKFKYQEVGTDKKPRFSQMIGWRDVNDL